MATCDWLGRAAARSQVSTATVGGTVEATDIFNLIINGKTLAVVAGSTVVNTVRDTIVTAWNASEEAEFMEITASAGGAGEVVLTGDTAGVPFIVTVSTTETGGGAADAQTFSVTTTTEATGPHHWNDVNNHSGGAVPVNGDHVTINRPVSILYGLDQSAVTLASITIGAGFQGAEIGLPRTNAGGYPEYREDFFKIGATICKIGVGDGTGSGRIKINFGSVQTAVEVRKTGGSAESGVPSVLLLGTHASNTLDVTGGSSVGVGIYDELSTFATITTASGTSLTVGQNVTLGDVTGAGTMRLTSAMTSLEVRTGGDVQVNGSGAITFLDVASGGRLRHESSGTITDAFIAGVVDGSGDSTPCQITNCELQPGGQIIDPLQRFVFPNGIELGDRVRQIQAA